MTSLDKLTSIHACQIVIVTFQRVAKLLYVDTSAKRATIV